MVDPEILIHTFERNYDYLRQQVDGLTHEDSLLQIPTGGNCLNWIVGHIVSARCPVMKGLGIEPIWTDEQRAIYRAAPRRSRRRTRILHIGWRRS